MADRPQTWPCGVCGAESEKIYRCSECGADLAERGVVTNE